MTLASIYKIHDYTFCDIHIIFIFFFFFQQTNMTLLVSPVQTVAVECTEVSPEFSDKPVEGDDAKVNH